MVIVPMIVCGWLDALTTGGRPTTSASLQSVNALDAMFRPPLDLLYRGTFEQVSISMISLPMLCWSKSIMLLVLVCSFLCIFVHVRVVAAQ